MSSVQFSSVQSLSCVHLFATPWTAACQASLSITNSWSLLKLMRIESVMTSNHLILCRPLLPPSIFPSNRVFSNESALRIMWPKYWSFNSSISPFNKYSGLISFRMDWLDLLAVQGTLKSLLQHHRMSYSWQIDWLETRVHVMGLRRERKSQAESGHSSHTQWDKLGFKFQWYSRSSDNQCKMYPLTKENTKKEK